MSESLAQVKKSGTHVARGRLGGLLRVGASAERIEAARREIEAATADAYIQRLAESAPPLTADQRARLAALLLPSDRGAAAT